VLAVVKKQNRPVSEVCHRFEPLPQVLKNVRYKKGKPLETPRSSPRSQARKAARTATAACVIRPSGTEPVIRVMGEGDDQVLVEEIVDDIVDALSQAAA
jgi:phosphoglucosamine mutase